MGGVPRRGPRLRAAARPRRRGRPAREHRRERGYYDEIEHVLEAGEEPYLRVSYERLVAGGERTRLLEFLGLPDAAGAAATLRMSSVRQNPAPLRELVTNFAELEDALAGTALAADLEGT